MTAPNECVQASGAKLLLTRTEAQAHLAPLICVRVYFLSKFIDLMPANILLWAGLVSIQITALKSSEFSPVGAVCYFTASQERLRQLLLPDQSFHFVSFGSINPNRLILSEDAQGVSEENRQSTTLSLRSLWDRRAAGDLVTLIGRGTEPTSLSDILCKTSATMGRPQDIPSTYLKKKKKSLVLSHSFFPLGLTKGA